MEKRWLSYDQMKCKYVNKIDLLFYNSIISAIPKVWKSLLVQEDENFSSENITVYSSIDNCKIVSKVYWDLVLQCKQADGCKKAWEVKLKCEWNSLRWGKLFTNIFYIMNNPKLRLFHYQIINRILVTNHKRNQWNSEISPLCDLCLRETETISHLLINCSKVQCLWLGLTK